MKDVKFKAHFNPHKKCISIDGDGQAELKFTTDATQLAKVLTAFANFTSTAVEVSIKKLTTNLQKNGKKRKKRVIR